MGFQIRLTDTSDAVLRLVGKNSTKALEAMGRTGKSLVQDAIMHHYAKAPYDTGRMYNSVDYSVNPQSVDIGTNTNERKYSVYVHEGTYKMAARPFLRDGLLDGKDALQQAAAAQLKQGF